MQHRRRSKKLKGRNIKSSGIFSRALFFKILLDRGKSEVMFVKILHDI
jgi:hypothetical protein